MSNSIELDPFGQIFLFLELLHNHRALKASMRPEISIKSSWHVCFAVGLAKHAIPGGDLAGWIISTFQGASSSSLFFPREAWISGITYSFRSSVLTSLRHTYVTRCPEIICVPKSFSESSGVHSDPELAPDSAELAWYIVPPVSLSIPPSPRSFFHSYPILQTCTHHLHLPSPAAWDHRLITTGKNVDKPFSD